MSVDKLKKHEIEMHFNQAYEAVTRAQAETKVHTEPCPAYEVVIHAHHWDCRHWSWMQICIIVLGVNFWIIDYILHYYCQGFLSVFLLTMVSLCYVLEVNILVFDCSCQYLTPTCVMKCQCTTQSIQTRVTCRSEKLAVTTNLTQGFWLETSVLYHWAT